MQPKDRGFRSLLLDSATVVTVLLFVVLAYSILNDRRVAGLRVDRSDRRVPNWEQYLSHGHRVGPSSASVKLIEFGDYECPFCRQFESTIAALRSSYPDDIQVVYRHYPLPYHAHAYQAARYAVCAALEGKFEAIHHILYAEEHLNEVTAEDLVVRAGIINEQQFLECARSTDPHPAVERDRTAGEEIGIRGTPAVIVNGLYLGVPDSASVWGAVRSALRRSASGL